MANWKEVKEYSERLGLDTVLLSYMKYDLLNALTTLENEIAEHKRYKDMMISKYKLDEQLVNQMYAICTYASRNLRTASIRETTVKVVRDILKAMSDYLLDDDILKGFIQYVEYEDIYKNIKENCTNVVAIKDYNMPDEETRYPEGKESNFPSTSFLIYDMDDIGPYFLHEDKLNEMWWWDSAWDDDFPKEVMDLLTKNKQ